MSPTRSNTAEMMMGVRQESADGRRLSPNANAMPASIPSVESKFPGAVSYQFPRPLSSGGDVGAEVMETAKL